jgi:hypothetical protein
MILFLFFLAFVVFVYFPLHTISPRGDKHSENLNFGIIYFGHISKRKNVEEFISDYHKLSDDDFLNQILHQIYENSKIAETKFKNYKKGLVTLQVQIFIFFILLGLKSFS